MPPDKTMLDFLSKHKDHIKIEKRYSTCKEPEPIKMNAKSCKTIEGGNVEQGN